jgi:hypothetical protein
MDKEKHQSPEYFKYLKWLFDRNWDDSNLVICSSNPTKAPFGRSSKGEVPKDCPYILEHVVNE